MICFFGVVFVCSFVACIVAKVNAQGLSPRSATIPTIELQGESVFQLSRGDLELRLELFTTTEL